MMKKYLFFILTICFSIGIIISELFIHATNLQIIFFLLIALLFISMLKNHNRQNIYPYLAISIILGCFIHQSYKRIANQNLDISHKIHLLKIITPTINVGIIFRFIFFDFSFNKCVIL